MYSFVLGSSLFVIITSNNNHNIVYSTYNYFFLFIYKMLQVSTTHF